MLPSERALLRSIVGGPELKLKTGYEYPEVILILGARSGKSRLVSAIAAYEACGRDWTKFVRKGEMAWCFVIATREDQAADIGRSMIASAIRASPVLSQLIIDNVGEAKKKLFPRSKAGTLVLSTGMAITALPCSSKVGRGYPIGICIMDEVAFFARESKNQATDTGIYESIFPRLAQFTDPDTGEFVAKIFMISTPADRTGLLWERYRDREKHRERYLCIRSPTWKIRTDFDKQVFARFKQMSPTGYNREFGAQFVDTLSPFINEKQLQPVLRSGDALPALNEEHVYYIGIDAAFGERDRFGIAVGHSEPIDVVESDGTVSQSFKIVIDVAHKIDEEYDKDLVDTALEKIIYYCEKYDTWEIVADQHNADAFGKLLEMHGVFVEVRNWTTALHRQLYGQMRSLILRRGISLPDDTDLIDELLGLQVKYMATSGQFTVGHRTAGHDDVSDAVALVVGELWEFEGAAEDVGIEFLT